MGKLLNLMDHLKINHNVNLRVEKLLTNNLQILFESLLGALYLDGGILPAKI